MEAESKLSISKKTLFYIKLKLVAATAFWSAMIILVLLTWSYHGTELELKDALEDNGLLWPIIVAMAISALVSLVRLPKEKASQ